MIKGKKREEQENKQDRDSDYEQVNFPPRRTRGSSRRKKGPSGGDGPNIGGAKIRERIADRGVVVEYGIRWGPAACAPPAL